MDPCPFVRIVISNLALKFPVKPNLSSYCKFKLTGFPTQVSDIPVVVAEGDAVESKVQACFSFKKAELEKRSEKSLLKIEVYRRSGGNDGCGLFNSELLGCVSVQFDLKSVLENNGGSRRCAIENGWVLIGSSKVKLHLNVKAEPDPRFVFQFDGDPKSSPQIFQVNGNMKQPVFTCNFSFRNHGERTLSSSSRSSVLKPPLSCIPCFTEKKEVAIKERKGWSITIHDLSGSPVAAASMVTPFVPSPGTDTVSRSNPGAWLILRPDQSTWNPWGRLEAWRQDNGIGYRFDLIPDSGSVSVPLSNSIISVKTGGKFSIDITNGPTPITSANSSFDLSSGSGSASDFGSVSGSGLWAEVLYRGFVMSSTVKGNGRGSRPVVEVGAQYVACTEDAAVFVALAAAMDLSMDACLPFSRKLCKEFRQ